MIRQNTAGAKFTLVLFVLVSLGCGDQKASVSGSVSFGDEPIPAGRIVFSTESNVCSADISDGTYLLTYQGSDQVPIDNYTVTVFPPKLETRIDASTGEEELIPHGINKKFFPKKYRDRSTSDIHFSPEPRANKFDVQLNRS